MSELRASLAKTLTSLNAPESKVEMLVDDTLRRAAEKIAEIERKSGDGIRSENGKPLEMPENIDLFSGEIAQNVLQEYFFKVFLGQLDADESTASEKYLTLHLKITKALLWKNCPESDAEGLADKTLELVAKKINDIERKLEKGITSEKDREIKRIENINAYAKEVMRLVFLEYLRKNPLIDVAPEDLPEQSVEPQIAILEEPDLRLRCLRKCIAEKLTNERDKELIIGYYDNESGEKNKVVREKLREKLGLSKINFKVRACYLRQRLEKCINECIERLNKNPAALSS